MMEGQGYNVTGRGAFQRRHYRALAEVIQRAAVAGDFDPATLERIVGMLTGVLAADNERFDRDRFRGWALGGKRDARRGGWA